MPYVLDKSAQIKFEETISSKDLSKDGKSLLLKFYELNVSKVVPKAIFGEYFRSNYASFRSIPKNISVSGLSPIISKNESDDSMEYTFYTEEDRGCKEIEITSVGRVHKPEIEAIVYCLRKNGMIFVTDDHPAIKLCDSLGVESITSNGFYKKAGIDKYLNK